MFVKDESYINSPGKFSFDLEKYKKVHKKSLEKSHKFWGEMAEKELFWFKKWDKVFSREGNGYKWFVGGKLNITYNCLDRHIASGNGGRIAYIWANEKGEEIKISYNELLSKVNRASNMLKEVGVKKGDVVTVYMPLCIEQVVAILAIARIGAIHSVVYAGFSSEALKTRIEDAKSEVLITSDGTLRRGKWIDLLSVAREAVKTSKFIRIAIIHTRKKETLLNDREIDFENGIKKVSSSCEPEVMDSNDDLFILYTSGTTGKPKGVVHSSGGYNLYTHITTKTSFDMDKNDIFWCTADSGWITGHSYIIYGPLSNNLTTFIYEGAPDYPNPSVWWEKINKYKVSVFYTSPTAIRMLKTHGDKYLKDMPTLRVLGSVGEPLDVAAWRWFYEKVGKSKCPVVDTWWQTETGGHMITTIPGLPQKPGFAGLPFFGTEAFVLDKKGKEVKNNEKGFLALKNVWPSALKGLWKQKDGLKRYWGKFGGYFFTGDLAVKDENGYIRILGRADDVINVSGHNIGSAELESVLCTHPKISESAAIGLPDALKGQKIVCFVVLGDGNEVGGVFEEEITSFVCNTYGRHAKPERIVFVDKLPKTRSGKILRRVLKAREMRENPGDLSTLED